MSRAFKSIDNQITTSSDYINAIRRKTLFTSIRDKSRHAASAQSVATWDNTYRIKWCAGGSGDAAVVDQLQPNMPTQPTSKLVSARSHAALLDISKGKRIANPVLNGSTASKFNIFTGNFAIIHPKNPYPLVIPTAWSKTTQSLRPITILQSSAGPQYPNLYTANTIPFPNNGQTLPTDGSWNVVNYPGWYFDPYGVLTNITCNQSNAVDLGRRLVRQVEIGYRWSPAYWRSVAGQSMSGISYPEAVTFSTQPTQLDNLTMRYGPQPTITADQLAASGFKLNDMGANKQMLLQVNDWCERT